MTVDMSTLDLDGFKSLQRLAYDACEAVAATLEPGVTEIEAARAVRDWLDEQGVDDFFHLPFAWFGDRTALRWRNPLAFFPTARRLAADEHFILDVAPIRDGLMADIGFSARHGTAANDVHDQLMDDLEAHRSLILEGVSSGATLRDVYRAVDGLAAAQGYECRHKSYPGQVIAHEVGPVSTSAPRFAFGFGLKGVARLARTAVEGIPAGWHPLWNGSKLSDHTPPPGLWAVEPHLAFRGVGAKFEEILVVEEGGAARWLDDDLPHVRRWAERAVAA